MNRTQTVLPVGAMAGSMTVAGLAAVGAIFLVPSSITADLPWVVFPALTAMFALGLLMTGQRAVVQARREAEESATTDPDTGLATYVAAERVLELEFAAAQRGRPLTVALIRVEQLPVYTRKHGPVVTRQMLRLASRALRKHRRGMHLTAHYGHGDGTFLTILSGLEPDGACVYAQRVRREIMALRGVPSVPPVSVSVVAFDMSMKSPITLMEQAERALAKAGEAGGKVVVMGQLAAEVAD